MKNYLRTHLNRKSFMPLLVVFFLVSPWVHAQNSVRVTGIITDITGEPLIGVSVLEIGATRDTVPGTDGNFSMDQ